MLFHHINSDTLLLEDKLTPFDGSRLIDHCYCVEGLAAYQPLIVKNEQHATTTKNEEYGMIESYDSRIATMQR